MQRSSSVSTEPTTRARWRVVDIVVAAVLGVAMGVVFWAWGLGWNGLSAPLEALLPGVQAFAAAIWLLAGVLGGLVIRKPGAAFFVEVVAAVASMLPGTQWGLATLEAGIVQGIGAEIIFAILLYRRWGLPAAWLAGAGAGLAMSINDRIVSYPGASTEFMIIYTVSGMLGGAAVAGTLSWLITRALAGSGALSRFASGREQSSLV